MTSRQQQRCNFPPNYSVAKAILDILLDIGENITLFDSPYTRMKRDWRRLKGAPERSNWSRYERAIRYLEERERVEIINEGDRLFIKLTKKGKLTALMQKLEINEKKREMTTDGKWRLVVWDIPESAREYRDRLRYFFKDLGFHQLQKSVFISPYPLPKAAVDYLNESGLSRFIRFLRVDKLDDDRSLRKHFKLD